MSISLVSSLPSVIEHRVHTRRVLESEYTSAIADLQAQLDAILEEQSKVSVAAQPAIKQATEAAAVAQRKFHEANEVVNRLNIELGSKCTQLQYTKGPILQRQRQLHNELEILRREQRGEIAA